MTIKEFGRLFLTKKIDQWLNQNMLRKTTGKEEKHLQYTTTYAKRNGLSKIYNKNNMPKTLQFRDYVNIFFIYFVAIFGVLTLFSALPSSVVYVISRGSTGSFNEFRNQDHSLNWLKIAKYSMIGGAIISMIGIIVLKL